MNNIIAVITDFGSKGSYAGAMKGVIATINSDAKIIDITNEIHPQNIREAAYVLFSSFDYFPKETIFLCIVDPGVGSDRKGIAARIGGRIYVGPDNGSLSYLLESYGLEEAYSLTDKKHQLKNTSNTFHGRDIFAPAAAYLSKGVLISEFGEKVTADDLTRLSSLRSKLEKDGTRIAEVIYIDRFGNLITSLKTDTLSINEAETNHHVDYLLISIGNVRINGLNKTYSDVLPGEYLAYKGSSGFIEIGKRNGNAARDIGATIGMPVTASFVNS